MILLFTVWEYFIFLLRKISFTLVTMVVMMMVTPSGLLTHEYSKVLFILPVLIVFIFFERQLFDSFVSSGVYITIQPIYFPLLTIIF